MNLRNCFANGHKFCCVYRRNFSSLEVQVLVPFVLTGVPVVMRWVGGHDAGSSVMTLASVVMMLVPLSCLDDIVPVALVVVVFVEFIFYSTCAKNYFAKLFRCEVTFSRIF